MYYVLWFECQKFDVTTYLMNLDAFALLSFWFVGLSSVALVRPVVDAQIVRI